MRAALLACLLLGGCSLTPQGQAFRQAFAAHVAELGDAAAEDIEWALCRLPYATVQRNFGNTRARAGAYAEICLTKVSDPVPIERSLLPGS